MLALGFCEGVLAGLVTQKLLDEDGELDWEAAIAEAGCSAVMVGFTWKAERSVKRERGGGSEALEGLGKTLSPDDIRYQEY